MRSITALLGLGVAVAALAGCGTATISAVAAPSDTSSSPATSPPHPPPTATPSVHFDTPAAAMTYLATAYNAGDQTDLKHVTTPSARAALTAMRGDAIDLRLVSCSPNTGRGDYTCEFDHDFVNGIRPSPDSEGPPPDGSSGGWAQFTVAPASSVGWYMTVLESCD